jgi:pyruvate dehydrogenase E2 component (dihydrolipoamide acetyltransferase)
MAEIIVMPRQGNTVESCLIVEWRKKEGDTVSPGDILCSVETDKATIDVESETSGTILSILRKEDEDVPVLDPIAVIGSAGEDISALLSEAGAGSAAPVSESPAPQPEEQPMVKMVQSLPDGSPKSSGAISPRARNLAASRGFDTGGLSGSGPGGRIIERDILSRIESGAPATPAAIAALAEESGSVRPARGSGIGGRVLSSDLDKVPAASKKTAYTDIPVKSIRKIIAERMTASLSSTAQLTLNGSAPAESLLRWRSVFKHAGEDSGVSGITINDLVLFAVSRVLPMFPEMNAHFLGDKIRRFSDVNIGVAVDTPKGLMVPVIHSADKKSLKEISDELRILAAKCREGSASPEELSGGTFTVTNLGAFGIESFTPVLNAPEVGILGVCSISPRAVTKKGETHFVPHIGLSLTIDHQAVDGAPGARFLAELSRRMGSFETLAAL